jgi:hypothetical protein
MGISQGGYGTCHLAPFMADLFAAAGPMAGGMMTVTENLRNLPFRTDIGEFDKAYDRIELAKELHALIDAHRAEDSEGYENVLAIQSGRGHGIDYSASPVWLASHTRDPYPEKIVWRCHDKDGVYRRNFYWLSLSEVPARGEYEIVASLDTARNRVIVSAEKVLPATEAGDASRQPLAESKLTIHLNDTMLDLDREIVVLFNEQEVFRGRLDRKRSCMLRNLAIRGDPNYAFPAEITFGNKNLDSN